MAEMTPEDMPPSDMNNRTLEALPQHGKRVFYPACHVNIVAGQRYEIVLVDFEEARSALFIARRHVDFKRGRRWIMDACCPHAMRPMFLWESDILDQIGNELVVGMPWNYDKFYDEHTLLVAA